MAGRPNKWAIGQLKDGTNRLQNLTGTETSFLPSTRIHTGLQELLQALADENGHDFTHELELAILTHLVGHLDKFSGGLAQILEMHLIDGILTRGWTLPGRLSDEAIEYLLEQTREAQSLFKSKAKPKRGKRAKELRYGDMNAVNVNDTRKRNPAELQKKKEEIKRRESQAE